MIVLRANDIHQPAYIAAYQHSVPGELIMALVEAESRRRSDAERWYTYDVSYIQGLISAGEWNLLQDIVNNITGYHDSDDISFGCTQQTPRWSVEYGKRFGQSPAHRNDLEFILEMREKYLNPHYALMMVSFKLRGLLDRPDVNGSDLMALFKYNRAAVGVMPPPANQDNYSRALTQARAWFKQDVEAAMASISGGDHSFNFGIGTKATELAQAGIAVGAALDDEQKLTEHITIQTAEEGVFWYTDSGHTLFLPGI